jgi:hypothetical protein
MITAQFGHGNGGVYRYYRCTKRLGPCSQKYIQEKELVEQLKNKIMKVSISEGWTNKMLDKVKEWEKSAKGSQMDFAQNLSNKIKAVDQKLDKLVNEFLDGNIEKEIYLKLKNELVQNKKSFEQELKDFGRNKKASFGWIEPLKEWIVSLPEPVELQKTEDFYQIKSFVQKIGTNHQLQNKKALFDFKEPYDIVPKYMKETCELSHVGGWLSSPSNRKNNSQISESRKWWRLLCEARTFFESKC